MSSTLVIPRKKGLGISPSKLGSSEGKLAKKWAKVPQKLLLDTFEPFPKHLHLVIDANGAHMKKMCSTFLLLLFCFINVTTLSNKDK